MHERRGRGTKLTASRERAVAAIAAAHESAAVPALTDSEPVLGLIDLDHVAEAFAELRAAFDTDTEVLHAVACKAVPLLPLLRYYAESGAGCEVASPGELESALTAGFAPNRIVFDSPAKTESELRRALSLGVSINVDSWEELERLDRLVDANTESVIGIRINPQSGIGEIGAMSTATSTSKFGIGLADPGARQAIVGAYHARPWLTQIHVHSGSQGIGLDQAAEGIAAVVDLAREINAGTADARTADARAADAGVTVGEGDRHGDTDPRQVTRIDIGGGLPVNFFGDEVTPTFADYRAAIEARVPELFDFDIVTEFGRSLLAKAGSILTRVEYAKTTGGRHIAITHAGVQVATRTAYAPADWPVRILPFAPDGTPKPTSVGHAEGSELVHTDVAGPACFAGDLLAEDRLLPRLDAGDLIVVPDTGAYYFSNPFSYNLLPRVPVYGYRTSSETDASGLGSDNLGERVDFFLIRRGQTIAEILAEAGGGPGSAAVSAGSPLRTHGTDAP